MWHPPELEIPLGLGFRARAKIIRMNMTQSPKPRSDKWHVWHRLRVRGHYLPTVGVQAKVSSGIWGSDWD